MTSGSQMTQVEAHEIIRQALEERRLSSNDLVRKQQRFMPMPNNDARSWLRSLGQMEVQVANEIRSEEPV